MTSLDDDVVEHLRAVADLPDLTHTRYQIVRKLNHGGMGTIYLVKDTALGREVALKVLNAPEPSGGFVARLIAEARHLARLEHPNIVPIHDAGQLPDGRVYYTMKLVRGRRLDEWRGEESGRSALLRLFQKICGAVAFAHAQGVIHRDLKPENVMVGSFGEALVLDWGVAKLIDEPRPAAGPGGGGENSPTDAQGTLGHGVTVQGTVIGTPAYMAPEQARGEIDRLDARCDVYALGAILYFLLAGRPPFEGGSPLEVIERAKREAPTPLRKIDPSVPRALEAICLKAMAAEPADRYGSARQMSDDVDRFLDGLPVLAHPESLFEKTARVIDRHRTLAWLVAAYILMRMILLGVTGR